MIASDHTNSYGQEVSLLLRCSVSTVHLIRPNVIALVVPVY